LNLPDILTDIMNSVYSDINHFPPTQIFNEGWLLRILLECHRRGYEPFPFQIMNNSSWFSEAQLPTPFKPRFRGDLLAENRTHVDGVYGHYRILSGTKSGLTLNSDAKQFEIIEAKLFSPLSSGVKNDSNYDQVARTVACMAKTIEVSRLKLKKLKSIGFYITAPQSQIDAGLFREQIKIDSIRMKVSTRTQRYAGDEDHHKKLSNWFHEYFNPMLDDIKIDAIPYETLINNLKNIKLETKERIEQYYERCLVYNSLKGSSK